MNVLMLEMRSKMNYIFIFEFIQQQQYVPQYTNDVIQTNSQTSPQQ